KADHLLETESPLLKPLSGGVSSDIYLVQDGYRKFVVKQALEKLKVEADWFADTSRNEAERKYIEYVGRISPESVPRVIFAGDGYFAMEYLGEGFVNWKQAMLAGRFEVDWAAKAGKLLGDIHRTSQGDSKLAAEFSNMESFWQLRIDPYLVTTGSKHPDLKKRFEEEAERLRTEASALVHGDFSPKNILVSQDRLVLLDCEVACYADPAFDLAFLFTHLFLKVLYHKQHFGE
ncbi:MAG: phosphotransferase, partial [Verrucomicrobiae bacterium]|nr:phosphotransferase [Verrucomicrobiae bacterium]